VSQLPRNVDVVIVGGGFAGMSTAWWLARRGVRDVLVLEREAELGRYASGRCAGLGRQLAEDDLVTGLTISGTSYLRGELAHAWSPTGGILTFDSLEHAQSYVERAARMGVVALPIDRAQVLAHWPQLEHLEIAAALHVPTDGLIDVYALLGTYAKGAQISFETGVERIIPTERGATLLTNRGSFVARVVVDATGAWAGRTTGDPPLDSFKRHLFVLEAVPPSMAPYAWHLGASELYVRTTEDGIVVCPADTTRVEAGDQKPDPAGEALLRTKLERSPLAATPVLRSWACQRTFPPRWGMKLERDATRPWLVWAVGLGGHGATASAAVGETVAGLVISALG